MEETPNETHESNDCAKRQRTLEGRRSMTDQRLETRLRLARERVRTARRTVLLFLIFGMAWVFATDFIARSIVPGEGLLREHFQTMKGVAFVLLSCLLIYISIIRHAQHVLAAEASSQQRLQHSAMEFRTMVDTMAEGVCTIDLHDRLLYANPRFCELTGFAYSEIVRGNLFEILSVPPRQRRQIKQGQSELEIKDRRGVQKLISMHTITRRDDTGRSIGTLCVINDLTDLKRSEAERERLHAQLEQMKRIESLGKLSGTMAHEFNNVMAGILPFTEVIERKSSDDEKILSATRYIRQAVDRGRRVSQEVLRFARPMPLSRHAVKAADLIERVEAAASSLLGASLRMRIVMAAPDEVVFIDLEQIEQVLANLLINAGQAMDETGTVTLSARRDTATTTYEFGVVTNPDSFLHIEVEDNGCGIAAEMLEQIFEPFITTKRRGTGLGLAITYQIVTNHGGHIFAQSTEGAGTTMHLFLPLQDAGEIASSV